MNFDFASAEERHSTETCYGCGQSFAATEWLNSKGQTIDTAGGMHFDKGWKCDACLGGNSFQHSAIARKPH